MALAIRHQGIINRIVHETAVFAEIGTLEVVNLRVDYLRCHFCKTGVDSPVSSE
jgi:hypothetical protein